MAKFLSEVTLSRLDSRREDTDRTNAETLVCLDDPVLGFIRCAQIATVGAKSGATGASVNRSVWCGEQDGAIIVRDSETCEATVVIERKPHAFVFCMCSPSENRVWAGLNDGHIRVFDSSSYHLLEEFKAHCSAVSAMAAANMPTHDDEYEHHMHVVVTCSTDWTISKWDAVSYQCLGRLQGHANAVRCICPSLSGEYLVSGGMDGAVRLWSLISNTEATAHSLDHEGPASSAVTSPTGAGGRTPVGRRGSSVSSSAPSTEVARSASRGQRYGGSSSSSWPLTGLHRDTVTCVCIVRDEYIVSGGSDGGVHLIAFDASGKWLRELERRPCGVTAIMHEDVNSRLWVAGVDGVISLYHDAYPSVTLLTSVHDHSGVYVMGLCPMERGNLFRFFVLDDEGQLTKFIESDSALRTSSNFELGAVSEVEYKATEEIDHYRDLVVRSYNELQSLRRELRAVEEYERRRKRGMTVKLGDDFQMKQFYVYKALRWLMRQKMINITSKRCEWMRRSSEGVIRGARYSAWLLWFRQRRNERRKMSLVMTMRTAAVHKTKTDVAFALADAARRQESECRMRLFVGAMTSQTDRGLLLAAFARWSAFALESRQKRAQQAVARAIAQSVDDQTGLQYWNRLVARAMEHELIERKVRVVESVMQASGRGLLSMYFRSWVKETIARRRDGSSRAMKVARQLRGADEELALDSYAARHALVLKYFNTWSGFRIDVQRRREIELAAEADREREMWEELLQETSEQAQEKIVRDELKSQQAYAERQLELSGQSEAIKKMKQQLFDAQRDYLSRGLLHVPSGVAVREKLRAIATYIKARGVSTYADMSTIALAKDAFSTIPLLPPAEKASSPVRALSPLRSAIKPKPKPKSKSAATSSSSPPKPAKPVPPTLGTTFDALLKKLRVTVSNSCTSAGLVPFGTDRGGSRVRSSSLIRKKPTKVELDEIEKALADGEDWGILPGWVDKIKKKDAAECLDLVKQLVILHDCIDTRSREPQASVASAQALLAANPPISEKAAVEFVFNSHVLVELVEGERRTRGTLAEYIKPTTQPGPSDTSAAPEPAPVATPTSPASATRAKSNSPRPPGRAPSPKSTPRRVGAPAAALPPPKPSSPAAVPLAKSRSPTPSARKSVPSPTPAAGKVPPRPSSPAVIAAPHSPTAKPSSPRSPPAAALVAKPYIGLRVAGKKTGPKGREVSTLYVEECPETFTTILGSSAGGEAATMPGPAYAAGLRVGDELVRFANYVVTDLANFNAVVARHARIGQSVPVQFRRYGEGNDHNLGTATVIVAGKKG